MAEEEVRGTRLQVYSQNVGLQLTPQEVIVCDHLNRFNQLRDFKLDAVEILEWKDTIMKLAPDATAEALEFAIDKMITGEIEYRKDEGIRNIFTALNLIEKTETGYKVKSKYRY